MHNNTGGDLNDTLILPKINIETIFEVSKIIIQQNLMANLISLVNLREKKFQKILMHLN